jgi:septum formation protein
MPYSHNTPAPTGPAGRPLILASTSRYRRELLERLRHPFRVAQPGVDEVELPGEPPIVRAERLAIAKARAVAQHEGDALVIGSDQVAALDTVILDKPGGYDRAREQLRSVSGRAVDFFTAVALVDARTGATSARVIPYHVVFRTLNDHEIDRYLRADEPYDCAASAKAESLGIALLAKMRGDDPTALIGLPLIALCELLRQHGVAVP